MCGIDVVTGLRAGRIQFSIQCVPGGYLPRGKAGRRVKLINCRSVSMLRMSGGIYSTVHMPSWLAHGQPDF